MAELPDGWLNFQYKQLGLKSIAILSFMDWTCRYFEIGIDNYQQLLTAPIGDFLHCVQVQLEKKSTSINVLQPAPISMRISIPQKVQNEKIPVIPMYSSPPK